MSMMGFNFTAFAQSSIARITFLHAACARLRNTYDWSQEIQDRIPLPKTRYLIPNSNHKNCYNLASSQDFQFRAEHRMLFYQLPFLNNSMEINSLTIRSY